MKFGTPELLLIFGIVLLVLGPTQLPKLTKMFGKATRSFKEGIESADEEPKTEKKEA